MENALYWMRAAVATVGVIGFGVWLFAADPIAHVAYWVVEAGQ